MSELIECQSYAPIFNERVRRQKLIIVILFLLALLGFFVGVLLIVLALVFGDMKQALGSEITKTSLGLVVTGASAATWKDVLDKWLNLVPFASLNERLAICEGLRPEELTATLSLAKSLLNKL